jgi:hypothetical protein
MSYDIIVRFPNKKLADEFAGQMSDGFGEGLCDFNFWQQLPDTDGTKKEHFVKVKEGKTPVYFVNSIFEP